MNSIIVAVLLLFPNAEVSDTTVITTPYAVQITFDQTATSIGASILNFLHNIVPTIVRRAGPERFEFTETVIEERKNESDCFIMHLADEEKTVWAHIVSNDSVHSFVRPPRKPNIPLHMDALQFVETVRTLFSRTMPDPITKRFFFETDTTDAVITETPLDTAEARQFAAYHPRRFTIKIRRIRDGELFTDGALIVGTFKGCTIYPKVCAWMKKDGVRMTLVIASDPKIRK